MVSVNTFLLVLRRIVMVKTSVLGLGALALSAHIISLTGSIDNDIFFQYADLALASGLLTVLSLPAMFIISLVRKGAVTSMIVVELCWMTFLWIMWAASAGTVANTAWIGSCGRAVGIVATVCAETQAIESFDFINWFLLMIYTIILLIYTVMAHMKGHSNIWTSAVREANFSAPPVQPPSKVTMENTGVSTFSAPQSQYPPYSPGTPVGGYAGTPQVQPQLMSPYPQV